MTLRNLRKINGLTQAKCAEILGIPLRTYQNYETREKAGTLDTLKYKYMTEALTRYGLIDEEHGVLTQDKIRKACETVFDGFDVGYCYLFGSYAKGSANEKSDIDLLVGGELGGILYFGMVEELRATLGKKIDLLNLSQVAGNSVLLDEILRYGIKIYG
ncbi:MAG: nucleotidyltransferase domain-containing protein [Roseburia sp.]|nr:nucleotidyltransferase domain-containing protein [Roseburia sp.]